MGKQPIPRRFDADQFRVSVTLLLSQAGGVKKVAMASRYAKGHESCNPAPTLHFWNHYELRSWQRSPLRFSPPVAAAAGAAGRAGPARPADPPAPFPRAS